MLSALLTTGLAAGASLARDGRPKLIGRLNAGGTDTENYGQEYFEPALRAVGWTPGQDVRIEARTAHSEPAKIALAAQELVAMQPDVLVAGSNVGVVALHRLTKTIPIVASFLNDPVGNGLAASLARPGGNVTGVAAFTRGGLLAKRLQLLTECDPKPRRIAVLWAPRDSSPALRDEMAEGGRTLGLSLEFFEATGAETFDPAMERIAATRPDALAISGTTTIAQQRQRLCEFALKERLPAIFAVREFAQAGMLMSYGPNITDNVGRMASIVDKILRGARPGDIAIEQPNGYHLAVNLRTARAIGVRLPATLLARADEIID